MGKRLYRIFEKDIPAQVQKLKNSEITVVLKSNKTMFGLLVEGGKESLSLKDLRMEVHVFNYSDIAEVIYDRQSAY